jgi:hypothetical protein
LEAIVQAIALTTETSQIPEEVSRYWDGFRVSLLLKAIQGT